MPPSRAPRRGQGLKSEVSLWQEHPPQISQKLRQPLSFPDFGTLEFNELQNIDDLNNRVSFWQKGALSDPDLSINCNDIPGSSRLQPIKGHIQLWKDFAEKHQSNQMINPFTDYGIARDCADRLDTDDERYGRPAEGSLTEYRGKKAAHEVAQEIVDLCRYIAHFGDEEDDGTYTVTFGKLFDMYTAISDKVVGMLVRARRQNHLSFEGEMLYQNQDEKKVITLFKIPEHDECVGHCLKWMTRN